MIAYDVSALHVISLNSEQFSLTQAMAQVQDGYIFHISTLPTTPRIFYNLQDPVFYSHLPQDRLPQAHHIQAHHLQDNAFYKTASPKCAFYCGTSHQSISYTFNSVLPHHLPFAALLHNNRDVPWVSLAPSPPKT